MHLGYYKVNCGSVVFKEKEVITDTRRKILIQLKTDGDRSVIEHLQVDKIDYCVFGNTHPYCVRIINKINDIYDHFLSNNVG